jgi:hypothetical protein
MTRSIWLGLLAMLRCIFRPRSFSNLMDRSNFEAILRSRERQARHYQRRFNRLDRRSRAALRGPGERGRHRCAKSFKTGSGACGTGLL